MALFERREPAPAA